jgi:hypothetical protein
MIQAESTTKHTARRSQSWYWLTLVPLILGASLALLRYAGWAAIYSAYYDRPSEAWRLQEAGPKAGREPGPPSPRRQQSTEPYPIL